MRITRILPLLLCLGGLLTTPAWALEYTIGGPEIGPFGPATSVEVVQTPDRGEASNEDRSKNAALVPPPFGSPSADVKNTGESLTPNLAPGGMSVGVINGSGTVVFPPAISGGTAQRPTTIVQPSTQFTAVTSSLYYSAGHLGTLKIPAIGLTVKVYEGTDSAALAKGAGHFENTSIWAGNIVLAGHNRGVANHFGQIHTLEAGDEITLTTKLGTRTYAVTSVSKVHETDTSGTVAASDNRITLFTCVRDQREYRWCVQGTEVVSFA